MDDTKRQVLPTGLWIVATPIGNLGDMTPRAIAALENADFILCEDTRRTASLLSALEIPFSLAKLRRWDAHTQSEKADFWIDLIQKEKRVALVTDAGTPGISDPGSILVSRALEAGIRVVPIPGASAVPTLLSVSGFQGTAFVFRGFFPRKAKLQEEELHFAATSPLAQVFIWFESPIRIRQTLMKLCEIFPDIPVRAAKELTKVYEKIFSGTATEVSRQVSEELDTEGELGEWCIAVQFFTVTQQKINKYSEFNEQWDWVRALRCLSDSGVSSSQAAEKVSQYFGVPKNVAYEASLKILRKK